jgi:hypothetical protein
MTGPREPLYRVRLITPLQRSHASLVQPVTGVAVLSAEAESLLGRWLRTVMAIFRQKSSLFWRLFGGLCDAPDVAQYPLHIGADRPARNGCPIGDGVKAQLVRRCDGEPRAAVGSRTQRKARGFG